MELFLLALQMAKMTSQLKTHVPVYLYTLRDTKKKATCELPLGQ